MRIKIEDFIFEISIAMIDGDTIVFEGSEGAWVAKYEKKKEAKNALHSFFELGFLELKDDIDVRFLPYSDECDYCNFDCDD